MVLLAPYHLGDSCSSALEPGLRTPQCEDRCKEEGIDASWGDPAKTPYQTRYQILKERLQENGIAFNGYSEINKLR